MSITRSTKTGGGTNFNTGTIISSADVNTDFNTAYTAINALLVAPVATTPFMRLPIEGATLPDASGSGNNPPEIVREVSSGSQTTNSPKATQTLAKFDAATDEHLLWTFVMPEDYVSGGTLRFVGKADSATSGAAYIKASIAPAVDSSTDDDAIVFNTVTGASWSAPGTQGQTKVGSITLTVSNVAANRKCVLFIGRDADGTLGTDDMTGDFILCAVSLSYSTS